MLSIGGKKHLVTHLVYELEHGYPPEKPLVCHSCDNPPCCNPKHLWAGTKADNNRDMDRKGRSRRIGTRGEGVASAKLTAVQVREIRQRRAADKLAYQQIGEDYGVTASNIWCIVTGRTWKHVLEEVS